MPDLRRLRSVRGMLRHEVLGLWRDREVWALLPC
jgi:hypothetical protein